MSQRKRKLGGASRNGATGRKRKQRGSTKKSAPAAKGIVRRNRVPLQNIRLKNRELVSDVDSDGTGSQLFAVRINAGYRNCFPWLSVLAPSFESYKVHNLSFEFCTSVGTDSSGTVAMAVEYDPSDDLQVTKAQMLTYKDSVRGPLWDSFKMRCTQQKGKKFFVAASSSAGAQARLEEYGVLLLHINCTTVTTVGELWIDYDIEFMTPQHSDSMVGEAVEFTSMTTTYPFSGWADATNQEEYLQGDKILEYDNGDQVRFTKDGLYLVTYSIDAASSLSAVADPILAGTAGIVSDSTLTVVDKSVDSTGAGGAYSGMITCVLDVVGAAVFGEELFFNIATITGGSLTDAAFTVIPIAKSLYDWYVATD